MIAADAELAKYVLSNEEKSEYNKLYHPYEWADFKALVPELPLDTFFTEVIGQTPDTIIGSRRALLEGICAKILLSSQLGNPSCQVETQCSSFLDVFLD